MKRTTRAALAAASGLAALALAAPADAAVRGISASRGTPTDYLALQGLSQPTATEIERTTIELPAFDGVDLHVEVTKPKGAGRLPVVLEASPYHGTLADREGTRILPGPKDAEGRAIGLTGYFAPRGYAVVMMDLRGTGRSRGCLDHLGPKDARDIEQVVEWAASQPWSNGRVGMTGHSYVGSTPMVAAAQRPRGLRTIVPSAGLASMYDHQFQAGVPYYLQYAGPIEAYEQLALERKLPPFSDPSGLTHTGDDFGNNPEDTGCGLPNSAAVAGEDQLSGRYADWHLHRDWRAGATASTIPMFLVHGVNDNAARVTAAQWFHDRGPRTGDKIWLGQWDHGSGCCPTRRGDQWTAALHAWFDKHLAGRPVATGPQVEVFLSDGTFSGARTGDRTEVLTGSGWGRTNPNELVLRPAADGTLRSTGKVPDGSRSFQGSPRGYVGTASDGALFTTGPLAQDVVLVGVPELRLSASVTAPRVHLIATLYERGTRTGTRRLTQCTINPELRNGIATRSLVVPGTRYDMAPPCMAIAQHVKAGNELVLRVSTADPDKVPTFAVDPNVTVFTGQDATTLRLPRIVQPALTPDTMPLEAQG